MIQPSPFYRAERLPVLQNRTFPSRDEARSCGTGDVLLSQDPHTGLISNQAFRPELLTYDAEYHNEQGLSSAFQLHLRRVSEIVQQYFSGASLIEVGCGKGHFLEMLQMQGFEVTGLDPAYEGSNPAILKQHFSADIGLKGDAIILRHVLEHIQDPVAFLAEILNANSGKGKIYIEVPCFEWICDRRAWFDIFYEHVNYFRLADFYRMFETVYSAGHSFDGQYLYVVADLATLRTPVRSAVDVFEFPKNFLATIDQHAASLRSRPASSSAIWGAASKGVIFALFMERAGVRVGTVIDINPAKQGRFLPVTGLCVQSPEAAMRALPPDAGILVMNGNYLEEVKLLTNGKYSYTRIDHESV